MSYVRLKNKLKCISIFNRIAYLKNKYKSLKRIRDNISNYEKDYTMYSTDLSGDYDEKSRRRLIIIETHILEKGLSHTDFRPGFGRRNVIDLQNNIIAYLQEQNVDQFAVDNALSILQLYHQTNEVFNFSDVDYVDISLFEHKELKCLVPYDLDIRKTLQLKNARIFLIAVIQSDFMMKMVERLKISYYMMLLNWLIQRQAHVIVKQHVFAIKKKNYLKK